MGSPSPPLGVYFVDAGNTTWVRVTPYVVNSTNTAWVPAMGYVVNSGDTAWAPAFTASGTVQVSRVRVATP